MFQKVPAAQQEAFGSLFEASPVGIVAYSIDGRLALSNPAFQQMLGYPPEELLGRHWSELTYAEDVASQEIGMSQMLSGETFWARKRYLHSDGRTVWADVYGWLHRDDRGEPSHYLGVIVDCGRRVLAETALRESEALFRSLVENIPDGITRFDAESRLLFIDMGTARLFGLDREQALGRRSDELGLPDELVERFRLALAQVFGFWSRNSISFRSSGSP